ncbi:hypothetical protein FD755_006498 [Muntiacus reevesi]|uniref:Uncharacterized protein n=1 Tax=Muntiacus reevesi TaxID=9886 RepID=A0A5J5MVI4_MUNRE|nr:hypothetical protein FD755_006498 [Muntiacus reevesi]
MIELDLRVAVEVSVPDQELLHSRRWDLPAGLGSLPSKDRSLLSSYYNWSPRPGHTHSRLARFRVSQVTPPALKGGVWEKQEEGRKAVGLGGPRGQMSSVSRSPSCLKPGLQSRPLEQAIRDAQECDDDEIQLYNEQIDTLWKETEEAERSLQRSYDCRQLVVTQQTLRNELDWQWQPTPVLLPGKSHGWRSLVGCSPWDLTRAVQDITAAKPRLKGLPKNLLRKKEMVAENRADEILEETPLRGPEDTKPGWVVLKEEGKSKLEPGDEEASPLTQEGAPEDVPDGGKISKTFEKLGKMIKEKVKGPKEPEPPADLYTKRRYMTGKEHGCPPTPHPADKGDEKNSKELKGLQGKQDGQKEEEGARRPCPMVVPGPEGLSTPRSQGPQVTPGGPKGYGAWSGSQPVRNPPRKLAYEKVEVMESTEKFSTGASR